MRDIEIGNRVIGPCRPCFVIAEVGINHGGDPELCEEMIRAASNAGADAVKLQTVISDESYHPDTDSYDVFKESELSEAELRRLMAFADKLGIVLFSTPGDPSALLLMESVGMPAIKISSGLLTNIPLIRRAARLRKPMILSSGMAYASEVVAAVETARAGGADGVAVLQCTSLYPAPAGSLNLAAISTLRDRLGVPTGYSDHHTGSLACIAAVAMGAMIVEKHFTLDASLTGADHAISLEPDAFAEMVAAIRDVGRMRGLADKTPTAGEIPKRDGSHRRLVAARDLEAGHVLAEDDFFLMRLPAERPGLPAAELDRVLGCRLSAALPKLSGLTIDMLEAVGK